LKRVHGFFYVYRPVGLVGLLFLGITSVATYIANAIFNITHKRIRGVPMTPEKLVMAEVEDGVKG